MSGHSKWHSIKHQKGVADARRGQLFTKLTRELIIVAREGGGNPEMNFRLRLAIQKARDNNMPADNIERSIKKGTGELEGGSLVELTLEGYGPNGTAILVNALTDNRNRTVAELRKIMELKGGSLGGSNCVAWMFETKGLFIIDAEGVSEDDLMTVILEAGADDMDIVNNTYQVTCEPTQFDVVRKALEAARIEPDPAELSNIPKTNVAVNEPTGRKLLQLMEQLEEHDDVQNVYANFELPEALLAELQE